MKRKKKLVTLGGVLVAVCIAAFAATKLNPDIDSEEEADTTVLSLDSDEVTAISWTYDGETVNLTKSGDDWCNADDAACSIDEIYPENMLTDLSSVQSSKTLEDPEDVSEYGLDNPQMTITAKAGDTTAEIKIGTETTMGDNYYMSTGDGNVYLVSNSLLTDFGYGINDIVEKETIPTMYEISELNIENGKRSFTMDKIEDSDLAYSDSFKYFSKDGDTYTALDSDSASTLSNVMTDLAWSSCANYNASEEDLENYGLASPAATVTVKYTVVTEDEEDSEDETDGETSVSDETSASETDAASETSEASEDSVAAGAEAAFVLELGDYTSDGCYARIAGSNMVYIISSTSADSLLTASADSLLPTTVVSMDWDNVTDFDVNLDGNKYTFKENKEALVSDVEAVQEEEAAQQAAETADETASGEASAETETQVLEEAEEEETEETEEETYETNEDGENIEDVFQINGKSYVDASAVQSIQSSINYLSTGDSIDNVPSDLKEVVSFTFRQSSKKWPKVTLAFYEYDSSNYVVSLNGEMKILTDKSSVDSVVSSLKEIVEK